MKNIVIAGPCAAESRDQILTSAIHAQRRNVDFMRVSLWKPRTKPGFEGLGNAGIDLLIEAAKFVNPGTEVLLPEQAKAVIERMAQEAPHRKILLWIGARNQNHVAQRQIAEVAASYPMAHLLVKNQPWVDEAHWEGVIDHVLAGGMPRDRLILCHRGFMVGPNPAGYRNVPDYAMSARVKAKTGLPMVFDPSHTGGSVANVFKISREAEEKGVFDGLIIEVHPEPQYAKTDAKQQLTWDQFDELREINAAIHA